MRQLFAWINREMQQNHLPAPIIAALAHYQYATIHPDYDGNRRSARLLTNLILHKSGYGLKGIYILEEYYAQDLQFYYAALATGPSPNYYFGRVEADVTGFVLYFCAGMASACANVRARASEASQRRTPDLAALLRHLDPRQRRLLELFRDKGSVTAGDIAGFLNLGHRTVVALCRAWVAAGFLCASDPSRKNRAYRLAERYDGVVGEGCGDRGIGRVDGGLPQCGLGSDRRVRGDGAAAWPGAVADSDVAQQSGSMTFFMAEGSRWLTAPIRNDTPRYPRLTGTKTSVFDIYLQRITKYPYLM